MLCRKAYKRIKIYDIMPKPLINPDFFQIQQKEKLKEVVETEINSATDFIQKLEKLKV